MYVAVIGEPFSGKTSFIKSLTGGENIGTFRFEDSRFKNLVAVFNPRRRTPPNITLRETSTQGINQGELIKSDAIVEICGGLTQNFTSFMDTTLKFLEYEYEVTSRNIERLKKEVAAGRREGKYLEVLIKARDTLSAGKPLSSLKFSQEEIDILKSYGFISVKPRLIIFNTMDDFKPEGKVFREAEELSIPYIGVNLLGLSEEEKNEIFQKILNISGHIVFFTPSEKEVRGWMIREGSTAVEVAGKIHGDLARTFIRAEVINWKELVEAGGWKQAKEKNLVKLVGRDYTVKDGDCIFIRASAIKSTK